jgi:hypothetical protein
MTLRWVRALLVGLLLLQAAVLAPAALALGAGTAMTDCAGHMSTPGDDHSCCPPGMSSHAGCGFSCLAMVALSGTVQVVSVSAPIARWSPSTASGTSQIYTPANPPPIG